MSNSFCKSFYQGAIFLYYAGRIKQVQGKLDEVSIVILQADHKNRKIKLLRKIYRLTKD